MVRTVDEWCGKNDDAAIPPRVKSRILERHGDACAECGRAFTARDPAEFDHTLALINGGAHREGNLRPLCRSCHDRKTGMDLCVKSKIASVRKAHFGLKPPSRNPLPGGRSSAFKKTVDGRVVRRVEE